MTPTKKGKHFSAIPWGAAVFLWLFFPNLLTAQSLTISQADSLFALEAYPAAIAVYRQLVPGTKAHQSAYLYWKMAAAWRRVNLDSMAQALQTADRYWQAAGIAEDTLAALIANEWGNFAIDQGEVTQAKGHFEKAYAIRQGVRPPFHPEIMASLNNLGQIAYFEDRDQDADRYYRQALAIARQNPAVPRQWQGLLLQSIANNYDYIGESDSAILFLEQALEQFQRAYPGQIHSYIVANQIRLVEIWTERGDYRKARALLEPLLQLPPDSVSVAVQRRLPEVLSALGDLFFAAGDFQKADDAYLRSQSLYAALPPNRPDQLAHLFLRQGTVAFTLGKKSQAQVWYQQALAPALQLDPLSRNRIFLNLARINLPAQLDSARFWLQQIPNTKTLAEPQQSQYRLLTAMTRQASLAPAYHRAIVVQTQLHGPRHPEVGHLWLDLARYFSESQQADSARYALQQAMNSNLRQGVFRSVQQDREALLSVPLQIRILTLLASLPEQLPLTSLEAYLQADSLMEDLNRYYPGQESQLFLRENLSGFYGAALGVLIAAQAELPTAEFDRIAFRLSERNKGFLLRTRLQELEALQQGWAPALQTELADHQNQLSILRNRLFAGVDSSMTLTLAAQIAAEKETVLQLEQQLLRSAPDYYSIRYQDHSPDPQAVQSRLQSGEMRLSYTLAGQRVFVMRLLPQRLDLFPLDLPPDWTEQLNRFLYSLAQVDAYYAEPGRVLQTFSRESYAWYQRLIEPALEGLPAVRQIQIIPDGILGYLPFEVLLTAPVTAPRDFRSLPYLVRDAALSYAYSLGHGKDHSVAHSSLAYVGFAPQYQSESVASVRSGELQNLPWAEKEVEFGAALFGGQVYLNETASETAFRNLVTDPTILHLSMHALVDDRNPLHSRLMFSAQEGDGALQVHEIYHLTLRSQLLVLSACNTGIGPLRKGEGIMSLARAFQYAGCPSILTSLWLVDDESAYQIHQGYFEALKQGQNKALALQSARLNFLQSVDKFKAHPFYWASLVQLGATDPLEMPRSRAWLGWVVGLLVLLVLGWRLCEVKMKNPEWSRAGNRTPKSRGQAPEV